MWQLSALLALLYISLLRPDSDTRDEILSWDSYLSDGVVSIVYIPLLANEVNKVEKN